MKTIKWLALIFSTIMLLDIAFDFGKWALGRYTEVPFFVSALMIVGFSAILATVVELIHRVRRKQERHYEQYTHHKVKVWVSKEQKGRHWRSSICSDCEYFLPDTSDNCLIESVVHITCRDNHLVLNVWECPNFKKKKVRS
jgi:hypothetical protein